jgi:hypothetical protein
MRSCLRVSTCFSTHLCVSARTHSRPPVGVCLLVLCAAGAVRDIHSQDSIHNGKKMMNPLDSACRILALGDYTATMNHIHLICEKYDVTEHGLRANDPHRTDRQNWAACERLAMRRVRATLRLLIEHENVPAQGTIAYLEVSTWHMRAHLHTHTRPRTCTRTQYITYAHARARTHTHTRNRSFGTMCLSSSNGTGPCDSVWKLRHSCCTSCACGAHGSYIMTPTRWERTSSAVNAMKTSPSQCTKWLS